MDKFKFYARLGLVVLFIGMAITIGGQHLRAKALKAEKSLAEQTASIAAAEAQGLRWELEANRAALEKREETAAELAAQTEALLNELDELYRQEDVEVCGVWAATPIPDAVYNRLR